MTLNRSADDSYGVMSDALIVAIEYIHRANISHPTYWQRVNESSIL